MKKQLLLVAAVALGLNACSDDSSPTGVGRDLLHNGNNVPSMSGSKYGQVLEEMGEIGEPDPNPEPGLGYHIAAGPLTSEYRPYQIWHVLTGAGTSSYRVKVHNRSTTEYAWGWEIRPDPSPIHVSWGLDASKYGLYYEGRGISIHIDDGANKTQWYWVRR